MDRHAGLLQQRIDYYSELLHLYGPELSQGESRGVDVGRQIDRDQSVGMEATTACATKAMSPNPAFSRGSVAAASPAMPSHPEATYCAACSTSRAPRYWPAATVRAAHRSAGTAPAYSCRHDRAAAAAAALLLPAAAAEAGPADGGDGEEERTASMLSLAAVALSAARRAASAATAGASRAARQGDTSPGRLTIGDFVRVAGQVKDPKVPIEVGKAAAGCGVLADAAAAVPL